MKARLLWICLKGLKYNTLVPDPRFKGDAIKLPISGSISSKNAGLSDAWISETGCAGLTGFCPETNNEISSLIYGDAGIRTTVDFIAFFLSIHKRGMRSKVLSPFGF